MLSKHRSVVKRINFFCGRVRLVNIDDDTGREYDSLEIDESLWRDMGAPTHITLTVVPGDKLNGR